MHGTRKRIWFAWCAPFLALLLAFGPISPAGLNSVSAQDADAEELIAVAQGMVEDLEPVDAPRTLDLEQQEDSSITLNFLNPADAPIIDFHLTFRAVAPRDSNDHPFDFGIYFRDQGTDNPYLNLVFISDGDDNARWNLFNEEGRLAAGDIDPELFPAEEGSRYNVEIAVIGDELAFAIGGEAIALVDISSNPGGGRIALSSGIFTETQVDGDIVPVSRISLYDLGGEEAVIDEEDEEGGTGVDNGTSGDAGVAESELYGFTVTFDPDVWELRDVTQTGQDYDSLGLSDVEIIDFVDGRTQVLMFAGQSTDTPQECVEHDIAYFDEVSTRYDFVGIAEDEDDEPISGRTSNGDGYYAVVLLDDNGPADAEFDEPAEITVYIECRPIVEGESMILIEHYARDAEYNDAIEGRIALLAGIDVSGGGSGAGNDDEEVIEDEEPIDEEEPADDGTIVVSLTGDFEGEATIEASGSSRSRVTVVIEGGEPGLLVVLQEGTCRRPAGDPAYEIGELDEQGEVSARIRVTPDSLIGEYAVTVIDPDTEDYEEPLACGNIR